MEIDIAGTGEKSLCVRAREMIKADPSLANEPIVWTRHGVPVFEKTHTVAFWARHRVVESEGGRYAHFREIPADEPNATVDDESGV